MTNPCHRQLRFSMGFTTGEALARRFPPGGSGLLRRRILTTPPKGLSPRDRMERKLLTKRGQALYKKRGVLVEPVFGQVKEGQGFRRFMRRGLGAAQSEWSLAGTTHNLLKLWRSGQAPWPKPKAPWN